MTPNVCFVVVLLLRPFYRLILDILHTHDGARVRVYYYYYYYLLNTCDFPSTLLDAIVVGAGRRHHALLRLAQRPAQRLKGEEVRALAVAHMAAACCPPSRGLDASVGKGRPTNVRGIAWRAKCLKGRCDLQDEQQGTSLGGVRPPRAK